MKPEGPRDYRYDVEEADTYDGDRGVDNRSHESYHAWQVEQAGELLDNLDEGT